MITALDPKAPIKYTLERDKANPTFWLLKNLSMPEERFLSAMALNAMEDGKIIDQEALLKANECALHIGLLGAENAKGFNWERDTASPDIYPGIKPWKNEVLSQLTRADRDELASQIFKGAEVQDSKNLSSCPDITSDI